MNRVSREIQTATHGVTNSISLHFLSNKQKRYGPQQNKTQIRFITNRLRTCVGLFKSIEGSASSRLM